MSVYTYAVRQITDRRRDDLDRGLEYWRNALARDEKLRAAFAAYQDEAIKKAQKLPNDLDGARAFFAAEVQRAGIKKELIEPPCRCEHCHDTGYVNGKYCKCVIKRVIQSNGENMILPTVDFGEAQKTAPKAISKVYTDVKAYVDGYPGGKPFFILTGSSGTGKTVLASATATELMSRGAAVVTISAFEFVRRAKDYHTQFAIDDYYDLFTPMLDCDLLVIDDLGTESMLKNVTREYFYTVINERWMRKKYTFITTNLTPNQLLERYGEAVFSRLCDKNSACLGAVSAPNARIKKQ